MRLSLMGYNILLKTLIEQKRLLAEGYYILSHDMTMDKKELIRQLEADERQGVRLLEAAYKKYFGAVYEKNCYVQSITTEDLVRLEADSVTQLTHLAKAAPNKELMSIYSLLAQKATNHGYMLLLIL